MKSSLRLLADIASRPTGLTGLNVHPNPRSTLIYFYTRTLEKLKRVPEHSVYRVALENLTRRRLTIVQSVIPDGYEAWQARVKGQIHTPTVSSTHTAETDTRPAYVLEESISNPNLVFIHPNAPSSTPGNEIVNAPSPPKPLPEEPALSDEQISDIEQRIGAGLIEEVIQVAQGEMDLVDTMIENEVWNNLVESALPHQWTAPDQSDHRT